jgi:hypothetical protein
MMTNYHRYIYAVSVLLIIVLLNSADAGAISPGDRVKIDFETTIQEEFLFIRYSVTEIKVYTGQLVSVTGDTISIIDDTRKAEVRYLLTNRIKNVYIGEGIKRNTVKGILDGAFFGVCLFGFLASGIWDPPDPDPLYSRLKLVTVGTAGSALLGGVFGWFTKVDRWRKLNSDEWRVNIDVGMREKSLSINISCSF